MGVGAGPGRADGPMGRWAEGWEDREEVWARGSAGSGAITIATRGDDSPRLPPRASYPLSLKPRDSLSTVWPKGALPLAPAASSHPEPACLPPPGCPPAVHPLHPSS